MSKKTVSIDFSKVNGEVVEMINGCLINIQKLALAERDLKDAKDALPEYLKGKLTNDADKRARRDALARETSAKASARERCNNSCVGFMMRYISTVDVISGDIYHFDVSGFLRNIGVMNGEGTLEDAKKGQVKKVEAFRDMVVDRYVNGITKRKAGDEMFTTKEGKTLRNNPDEIVLALAYAFVDSGCFEWDKYQLIPVDFSAKKDA